jgi:tripartite-type tricarboxylate transporter receptor subunit TctC
MQGTSMLQLLHRHATRPLGAARRGSLRGLSATAISATAILVLGLALGLPRPGSAAGAEESYPSQNVKFVVAFPAGGPTDALARILGQRLSEKWGQGIVIENRGGAGGNIAARQIAKAEPTGYAILVTTSAFAVNPSLTANAGYVPESEFKTAIIAATTPNIIVASKTLPAVTLAELVAAAKREKLSYGMPGPGTTPHLSAERIFKSLAKVDIPPVSFTGAAPLLNALLGGHIPVASLAMPPAIALIKSGEIKALAVLSDKRVPSLPQVATAIEQGFGDSEESTWIGLFVPAATPLAVINKLNGDANAVLVEAAIAERLEQLGMVAVGGSPENSETYVRSEIKKWGEVVRSLGLKVD